MKRILLSVLACGIIAPAALADSAGLAGSRMVMTDTQMDAVTAGLTGVAVIAEAHATGDRTRTSTSTSTSARGSGTLEIASGRATASASGSESSDVGVGVALVSDREPIVANTLVTGRSNGSSSHGSASGYIVTRR